MTKQNIGNAGEYFIAYKLSCIDFIATITLGRAEKFGILALSSVNKHFKISVKTRFRNDAKSFPLSKKDEEGASDDCYYAFVKFNDTNSEPDYWIIPTKRVCQVIKNSGDIYFKEKKRKDRGDHRDVGLRSFDFKLTKSNRDLYDEGWKKELEGYYKNMGQLM